MPDKDGNIKGIAVPEVPWHARTTDRDPPLVVMPGMPGNQYFCPGCGRAAGRPHERTCSIRDLSPAGGGPRP